MLDDSFPTTKDDEQRFADLSEDIVTTDWRAEARQPPDGSDFDPEEEEEEIYESRKLVMRQLVMNQLHQTPEDQLDAKSEADSWLEMEERFAEIYQPIPYNVAMDSWRTMTKEQMLQTVTSRRLRSQMKYMSRAEILGQIQTLKIQHQEKKKKQKESLYEDLPVQAKNKVNKKTKKVQLVTNQSSLMYQNTANYSGESLAEIYQAKVEARKQELRQQQQQQQNGLYVTRAMVHAAPSSDDERETRSPVRLSRADILSKYAVPAPITPQKRIVEVSRPIPDETIIKVEPLKAHPSSSSSTSSCDGACCPGVEDCSMCSCSSCNSSSCCNSDSTVKEGQSSRIPASLVKQRRMEFERLRILEEQEVRLQELVRRQQIKPTMDGQGWLSLARKARQLEDRWTNRVRTSSTLLYEPIQVGINSTNNNVKKKKTKRSSKSKQRSRIIQQLRNKMRENMAAESMDPRDRQRRHMELKELLSDALHGGSQTLTNINLGLIYVPMEEQLDKSGALMSLTSSRTGLANSKEKIIKPKDEEDGDESEDLFASIDTLIFEPKSVVEETSTSTIKSDELRDVEQRIAQQFDYLNDSQYGSGQDEEASASASTSSSCEECARSDDQDDESKNGRRAAAAPAMVQTTAVTAPSSGLIKAARGEGSASCAAAASCADSVYNDASSSSSSDGDSLTSFGSVIYQGQKLLQEEIQRNQTLPPPASAFIDSEHYEDTDASWDYYNPDQDKKEPSLLVGNLRKRPSSDRRTEDEADETARLLESLRMAEDTHVSTSLRLIFPPSRDGTNFRIPVRKTSFIEMALENDRSIHLLPTSPDSGFRSLPELSHERVEPPLPTGIRKRDTMIRELKTKLKDKFQPQDDVDSRHSDPPSHQPPPVPVQQPSARKKTALDKLGSILSTFNSFAQMEGQGRIYRKSVIQQQPQSLPAGISSSNAGYDIPSKHNPILSTGYPHHLLSSSEPTTIYDPSLPEDVRQRHHYDLPHQDDYPLPMEPLASLLLSNPYLHESLYNISEPLDEPPSGRKRKSRTRRRRETEKSANWSDIEELIFGEEAALLSCPGVVLPPTGGAIQQHHNRMDPYHRDEWLFWDQLHQWRRTEMDRERWEEERARRMLLWIHHSQSLEAAAGASSSSIPHWWQV